jgi:hypothetical protein
MKTRKSRLVAIAALIAAGLLARSARASLTMNLRFANGSDEYNLTSADVGHDIEIDVWATITGYNPPSNHNFFALQYAYFAVASSLPDGPTTAVGGALASGSTPDGNINARVAPFNAPGGQVGTIQDFNGDGVADLGPIVSGAAGYTDYGKLRSFPITWSDANLSTENLLPNGCEFEVEKLFFHVTSLSGEETDFDPVSVALSPPYASSVWGFDLPADTGSAPLGAQYTQSSPALAGTGVEFLVSPDAQQASGVVPEPTTAALIIGASLLPLVRRGKHTGF